MLVDRGSSLTGCSRITGVLPVPCVFGGIHFKADRSGSALPHDISHSRGDRIIDTCEQQSMTAIAEFRKEAFRREIDE